MFHAQWIRHPVAALVTLLVILFYLWGYTNHLSDGGTSTGVSSSHTVIGNDGSTRQR